jgi:hypothetical protein
LRLLLFGVVVIAIGMAWVSAYFRQVESQRRVTTMLTQRGASVYYDWEWDDERGSAGATPPPPVWQQMLWGPYGVPDVEFVYAAGSELTGADLEQLFGVARPRSLTLVGCKDLTTLGISRPAYAKNLVAIAADGTALQDSGLFGLRYCTQLEHLSVDNTPITNAALVHIEKSETLTFLGISGTSITDDGLVHVANLRSLQHLGLADTCVTSTGVAYLAHLPRLKRLNLSRTKIDNRALEVVPEMKSLERLTLAEVAVSQKTIDCLKAGMPHLQVLQREFRIQDP